MNTLKALIYVIRAVLYLEKQNSDKEKGSKHCCHCAKWTFCIVLLNFWFRFG